MGGVFLGYIAPLGYAFLDRGLYLPADWCADEPRRAAAKIPSKVQFQTNPQLAQQMLSRAWAEQIPMQWVTADTTYGNSSTLRNFIHKQERYYVMEVPQTVYVQSLSAPKPQAASEVAKTMVVASWARLALEGGKKGLNFSEWAVLRVTSTTDTVGEQWLLCRRRMKGKGAVKYYLSNAPAQTSLETLAAVASSRWQIGHRPPCG